MAQVTRRYRETPEVAAGVVRLVRALGKRTAEGDPEDLIELNRVRLALDEALDKSITGLRKAGHSDAVIAAVLGVTRQAVWKRWPHEDKEDES